MTHTSPVHIQGGSLENGGFLPPFFKNNVDTCLVLRNFLFTWKPKTGIVKSCVRMSESTSQPVVKSAVSHITVTTKTCWPIRSTDKKIAAGSGMITIACTVCVVCLGKNKVNINTSISLDTSATTQIAPKPLLHRIYPIPALKVLQFSALECLHRAKQRINKTLQRGCLHS